MKTDTKERIEKLCCETDKPLSIREISDRIDVSISTVKDHVQILVKQGRIERGRLDTSNFSYYAAPGYEFPLTWVSPKCDKTWFKGLQLIKDLIVDKPLTFQELQERVEFSRDTLYKLLGYLKSSGEVKAHGTGRTPVVYSLGNAIVAQPPKVEKPKKVRVTTKKPQPPKQAIPVREDSFDYSKPYTKDELRVLSRFEFRDEVYSYEVANFHRIEELRAVRSLMARGDLIKVGRCPVRYVRTRSRMVSA
jgi:predicted transcriptional regulator